MVRSPLYHVHLPPDTSHPSVGPQHILPTSPILPVAAIVISGYTAATVAYTLDEAITSNSPTTSGGDVVTWAIGSTLPAGLSFSTLTGVISGTPTDITGEATYTVTATNTAGAVTFDLSITVNDGAFAREFVTTQLQFVLFFTHS